jgi:hypothetical protein
LPVKANEPRNVQRTCKKDGTGLLVMNAETRLRKSLAATIGPMVCELDGPIPILKRSRTLMNIVLPVKK